MTAGTTVGERTEHPVEGDLRPEGPPRAPVVGRGIRLLLAVGVALLVGAGLLVRLGLVGGDAIGAADNGDAIRLYCVADLVPDTSDRAAPGHGVAVTEYRTGGPGCPREAPTTSAGLVLQATVAVTTALDATPPAPDGSDRFSLEWLAAVYAGLLAAGAGIATFAATSAPSLAGRRAGRVAPVLLAVVVPPLLPLLAVPWWSRFLVSSFSESAGLLGAAWMAWGLLTVAATRPTDRGARAAALGLIALGGVVAATGKPGFLPVGLVAVGVCAVVTVGVRRWWRRAPGLAVALLAVAVAVPAVLSGVAAQDAAYDKVNAHNLAFTAVLPESGPAATGALGLRPEAFGQAGQHFYLDGGRSVPGWAETVGARPDELRSAARLWVAQHPLVLARMVHRGLVATLRPHIPYLASETGGPRTVSGEIPRPSYPEGSQLMGPTFVYFDGLPGRWVPPTVVVLALLAAALALIASRVPRLAAATTPTARGLALTAGALAVTALGIVLVAVLGDGYCELAKHVWLGSYLLVVTAATLVASGVAAGAGRLHARGDRGDRTDDRADPTARPVPDDAAGW
ncbi:hypothetical protein [Actinomycetospora callitridis]|uniref:glycan biosynthesis hexose transferase WsfD n=1 Tax=Actinomycetospora callitridis TaxID=913944 RepID=UPI0023671518|nr:hypothetical protein [Actinomycetospora callitridis]MDD7919365.1 hypothetical protein [Actinomycetospora callitridis]